MEIQISSLIGQIVPLIKPKGVQKSEIAPWKRTAHSRNHAKTGHPGLIIHVKQVAGPTAA